ncbi:MAG TPA: M55 family metallopeptidase [Thermoanaerobaculia bacterium]|nr:M55 family metallopeptidase [Thermoanaerobaculia bacterium]
MRRALASATGRAAWAVLLAVASTAAAAAQEHLKVYVSADMEGVAGVVTADQLGPPGFEYERFRGFMTDEVLAAIEGARAAGATEFLVSDSHGNGQNLLIERFPKDIQIVRSWPRPLAMMQGIDASFGAVLFVGYHASTTNPEGVRAHTMSSAHLADLRLNGVSMPEAGLNAAIAGQFGVPVAMISGDDAIIREAQALLGPIVGAVVKWNYGFHSARTLTPQAACDAIREAARRAVAERKNRKPFTVTTPVTLDLRFKNYRPAEVLAYLPIVERTDAHAIRFRGKDMVEVSKFLEFVDEYEPGLAP